MARKNWLLFLILVLVSQASEATFSADELLVAREENAVLFEGYVAGVAETMVMAGRICPNGVVTFADIAYIIKNRIDKLQGGSESAISFVMSALKLKYACKGSN